MEARSRLEVYPSVSKVFVGSRCATASKPPELKPISKVVLWVDSENCYEAGDNSGREIEITCPYGDQVMANDILGRLSGYAYRPMDAQSALLDPAAELGDAVTVNGCYTLMASMDLVFDGLLTSDIAAPGASELPQEYTFTDNEKILSRKIARANSTIAKTSEEIQLKVEGLSGDVTSLSVTLEGVTITDETSGKTLIKGGSIDTDTLNVKAANVSGALKAGSVQLEGLLEIMANGTTWGVIGAAQGSADNVPTKGAVLADLGKNNFFIATELGARMSYYGTNDIYCASNGCRSTSAMQVDSDRRLKNSISYDLSKEEQMFRSLRPCTFAYNRDKESKRHLGFIAQEMVEGAINADMDADIIGFVSSDDAGMYSVAYEEITPLNTHMIQKLLNRIESLEKTVDNLTRRLKETEEENG